MSSEVAPDLYPIAVIEDRYQGVYSNGRWWAVAQSDCMLEGMTRIAWLLEYGPSSDDVTASVFWRDAPPWIAAANTPDAAVGKLEAQIGADSDDWLPPPVEADPRWRESFRPSTQSER
ncbi:hypothetical protein GCM10011380_10200 [Sphingomonas metalli]|uniref:Uncharacterized protein n=1 Tax=Sphingomonas metalli TaxID=1779358 RepID=A0A916WRB8_9SPHN|nr:hypothetical protein GCM10011380_10200 [Sphingomonas metalli]